MAQPATGFLAAVGDEDADLGRTNTIGRGGRFHSARGHGGRADRHGPRWGGTGHRRRWSGTGNGVVGSVLAIPVAILILWPTRRLRVRRQAGHAASAAAAKRAATMDVANNVASNGTDNGWQSSRLSRRERRADRLRPLQGSHADGVAADASGLRRYRAAAGDAERRQAGRPPRQGQLWRSVACL